MDVNTVKKPHEKFRGDTGLLFNIIIAILIGSRYAFLIDWPDTLLGKIYFFISLLGHFSFVFCLVFAGYFSAEFYHQKSPHFPWLNGDYCDNLHHIAAV